MRSSCPRRRRTSRRSPTLRRRPPPPRIPPQHRRLRLRLRSTMRGCSSPTMTNRQRSRTSQDTASSSESMEIPGTRKRKRTRRPRRTPKSRHTRSSRVFLRTLTPRASRHRRPAKAMPCTWTRGCVKRDTSSENESENESELAWRIGSNPGPGMNRGSKPTSRANRRWIRFVPFGVAKERIVSSGSKRFRIPWRP